MNLLRVFLKRVTRQYHTKYWVESLRGVGKLFSKQLLQRQYPDKLNMCVSYSLGNYIGKQVHWFAKTVPFTTCNVKKKPGRTHWNRSDSEVGMQFRQHALSLKKKKKFKNYHRQKLSYCSGPFLTRKVAAGPNISKERLGYAKMPTASSSFVVCTLAYTLKPRFPSWLPWWHNLMNIHWEWSIWHIRSNRTDI